MGKQRNLPEAPEFPQLAEIADPERMAAVLQRHMGPRFASGELAVARCKIKRIYHKPGPEGNCRLQLEARIRDAGRTREQILFAQVWPTEVVAEQYARALQRARVEPEYGESVALVREWNMILWAHPNDPRLRGLPHLSAPEAVLRAMGARPAHHGLPADQRPVGIEVQPTKYVPGQRCGCLFRVKLDPGGAGRSHHSVYGKAYRSSKGRPAYERALQIWNSAPRRRGELRLPEPYSYDDDLDIFWQEALPGQPLAKTSAGGGLPEIGARVGKSLAAFHGADLELPVGRTLEAQLEELGRNAAAVSGAFPDQRSRVAALRERLERCAADLGAAPRTPVHGSFKLSHVFLCDGGVALIDFDGASLGDPGYDLGRFLAHVEEMRVSRKLADAVADETTRRFVESYNAAAQQPLTPERIRWYAAGLILSSQVYKAVKRFDPARIGQLLSRTEGILNAS